MARRLCSPGETVGSEGHPGQGLRTDFPDEIGPIVFRVGRPPRAGIDPWAIRAAARKRLRPPTRSSSPVKTRPGTAFLPSPTDPDRKRRSRCDQGHRLRGRNGCPLGEGRHMEILLHRNPRIFYRTGRSKRAQPGTNNQHQRRGGRAIQGIMFGYATTKRPDPDWPAPIFYRPQDPAAWILGKEGARPLPAPRGGLPGIRTPKKPGQPCKWEETGTKPGFGGVREMWFFLGTRHLVGGHGPSKPVFCFAGCASSLCASSRLLDGRMDRTGAKTVLGNINPTAKFL